MTKRISRRIPSKYGALLIAVLAVASVFVALFRIEVDNRFDRMLDQSSQEARDYESFLDEYGSDEFVVLALSGKPLFEEAALDTMLEVLDRLEQVPYIVHVAGIPTIFRDRFGAEDPEALEEEMMSTPFFHGLFLSPDQSTAGLLIETDVLDEPGNRREMVDGIEEAIVPLEEYGFRTDLVGVPVFNVSLNKLSMRESFRSFPLAAVASLIVLLLLLRSIRASIVVLSCGALSLVLTFGAAGLIGRPLNVVTSSLPLLLWVLSLANCIHVVCRYQHFRNLCTSLEEALEKALDEVAFPCALSAITTAFGFISLMVAEIGPVRELGLLMALGMIISLAVNLVMGSRLLLLMKVPPPRWMPRDKSLVFRLLADGVLRSARPIVFVFVLLIAVGLFSLTKIRSEPNSLTFLPEDSKTVQSYRFVSEHLTGVTTLEVLVDTPGSWLDPAYWAPITAMVDKFAEFDIVPKVLTPLDFLKKMNQWDHDLDPEFYVLPDSREDAETLLEVLDENDSMEINRLVSDDGTQIRLTILVGTLSSKEQEKLIDLAREELAALPEPLSGRLTGMAVRMQKMQRTMVTTQIRSFSLAFVLVFASILVGLRSIKLTLISVIPNIIPILSAFTTMAILDISLDPATVMVASIALGIAVDDAVHFLAGYRRERALGTENLAAIRATLSSVGPSITVTTITACIGFFALARSAFVPVAYFGMLSGIAMIFALAANLFLVPAMLSLRRSDS